MKDIEKMTTEERYAYYEEMYLDYFNNFLTVERFAEHYDIDVETANKIIESGRIVNHNREKVFA